jgi:hypothetical protein
MNTGVRTAKTFIEEFAKNAHATVDMLHERAIELDGNLAGLATEASKVLGMVPTGTKLGKFVENNPQRAQLFALMTGVMFTHMMKNRGYAFGVPTAVETEKTVKAKPKKVKVA